MVQFRFSNLGPGTHDRGPANSRVPVDIHDREATSLPDVDA